MARFRVPGAGYVLDAGRSLGLAEVSQPDRQVAGSDCRPGSILGNRNKFTGQLSYLLAFLLHPGFFFPQLPACQEQASLLRLNMRGLGLESFKASGQSGLLYG